MVAPGRGRRFSVLHTENGKGHTRRERFREGRRGLVMLDKTPSQAIIEFVEKVSHWWEMVFQHAGQATIGDWLGVFFSGFVGLLFGLWVLSTMLDDADQ